MGSHGIKDRVAIVGMGCTNFGERFDTGLDDLIIDASNQAFGAAGVDKDTVDAYWFGTAQSGMSGITLAKPLQLEGKPVTRIENYCATGSEALRQAAYAVASGAYDIAMAVGAEKVKDSGFQGLNGAPIPGDGTRAHPDRRRDVQHGRARIREAVRRRRGRDQRRARAHRMEEPLQRRAQPARPVQA
jgi:acetyl-CoA C-acetyltransferase